MGLLELVTRGFFELGGNRDRLKLFLFEHSFNVLILLLDLPLLECLGSLSFLFESVILFLYSPCDIRTKQQKHGHYGCMSVLLDSKVSPNVHSPSIKICLYRTQIIGRFIRLVLRSLAPHNVEGSLLLFFLWLGLDLFQDLLVFIFGLLVVGFHLIVWGVVTIVNNNQFFVIFVYKSLDQ